jgi:hypothetical protein
MEKYEEYKVLPQFWGWLVLILASAIILGWGMFLMFAVPEVKRAWDFGTVADTPAESAYSTNRPPTEANAPRQVEQLPGTDWSREAGAQL